MATISIIHESAAHGVRIDSHNERFPTDAGEAGYSKEDTRQSHICGDKPDDDGKQQNARDCDVSCVCDALAGPGLAGLISTGSALHLRNRFGFPHLDSNQDKGFQRPVCCHYTMGEERSVKLRAHNFCIIHHPVPYRIPHRAGHGMARSPKGTHRRQTERKHQAKRKPWP